jgi:hypothetical protein
MYGACFNIVCKASWRDYLCIVANCSKFGGRLGLVPYALIFVSPTSKPLLCKIQTYWWGCWCCWDAPLDYSLVGAHPCASMKSMSSHYWHQCSDFRSKASGLKGGICSWNNNKAATLCILGSVGVRQLNSGYEAFLTYILQESMGSLYIINLKVKQWMQIATL